MMRLQFVVLISAALGAGCTPPSEFANAGGAEIVKMLQEAQKSGWVRHDADGYFAVWADGGKRVEGRAEAPGDFDTTLPRAKYEAVTRLRFAVPPPNGVFLTFDDAKAEVSGDSATVRFTMAIKPAETYFGMRRTLTTGELFRLRRSNGKWHVEENRSWPIESWAEDQVERFDKGQWDAMDHRVESAQTLPEKATGLEQGRRYAEAYAAAKEYSEQEGVHYLKPESGVGFGGGAKDAHAWVLRGYMAIMIGDAAEAKASFKKALELDANAGMADYARAAAK